MYSHMITSAITVGFGGSVGLEAPILVTGSAIGSNLGKHLSLNYKDRTLLLAAGAAAGIAAIFNAPITGVVFAIEVLLAEVSITEFIPLIIAAVCGALANKVILNEAILFTFTLKQDFNYHNVPFYLGLGLLCGAVSLYYARTTGHIEHFFARHQKNAFSTALLGGTTLALLCFLFPPLFGEGYELIIPLMIVSAISFLLVRHFEPFSMDTKKLAAKGQIFTADKDKNILTMMRIEHLLERDIVSIAPEATLGDLVEAIKASKRNLFAVVAEGRVFNGLINLDDVREIMFRQDLYDVIQVRQLMKVPAATVQINDTMQSAMKKFDTSQSWNLPVLNNDIYLGFISKSSIFTQYRHGLMKQVGIG